MDRLALLEGQPVSPARLELQMRMLDRATHNGITGDAEAAVGPCPAKGGEELAGDRHLQGNPFDSPSEGDFELFEDVAAVPEGPVLDEHPFDRAQHFKG